MNRLLPKIKLLLVIIFTFLSVQWGYSQALLVENFDYDNGALLTASGWSAHSGAGSQAIDVVVPGLSFAGYPLSGVGGAALLDATGEDVNKTFTSQTSGTVYTAFMVKVDAVKDGYFIHLGQSTIGTTFFAKVWLKTGTTGYTFGLQKNSETAVYTTTEYTLGTTYLLVLKYNIVAGTANDEVSLYIIDGAVPASEPATATIPVLSATGTDYNPGSIALRQHTLGQNIQVDGIRIGNTWADAVTNIPSADVTAPVFTSGYPKVDNINSTQANIQVNMDEAGTAYYVVVPDGSTAPTAAEVFAGANYGTVTLTAHGTINVPAGNAIYSSTITGLTDKTNYDIYVIAQDDETTPNQQTAPVLVNLYTIAPPDVIYSADFASSLSPFTQVSITGDQVWTATSGYAKMSGYASSTNNANVDYLISPALNLNSATDIMMSFTTMMNYTDQPLQVMISSNFNGTFTPEGVAAATWTDISSNFTFSPGSWASTESGKFSLAGYTGTVYIAFVYTSTTTGAATWEVDNFLVTGYKAAGTDASLSDIKVDGTTITGFAPATYSYSKVLDAGTTTIPTVTYTTNDPFATVVYTAPTDLAGNAAARTATIAVTASDATTKQTYTILFSPVLTVANLAALRAVATADYDRVYKVTGEVIVSGNNTTNRNQRYVQDATAGVLIDDNSKILTVSYNVGDGITGLTGTLLDYFGMLEFIPTQDAGAATTTGNSLTVQTITLAEFNTNFEDYEAELVKIEGAGFDDANGGTAKFEEKKNYNITIGATTGVVRTVFLATDLTGVAIPYKADVTGIAVYDYSKSKIAPRNLADLNAYSSANAITGFAFNGLTPAVTGVIDDVNKTVTATVPAGTSRTALVPTITVSPNATVSPASGVATDFSSAVTYTVTAQDGTPQAYTVTVSVASGIDTETEARVKVGPVPATTELKLMNVESVIQIEIYNVAGLKISSSKHDSETLITVPLNGFAPGIYFIRFTTAEGTFMKKFIKQ